MVQQITITVDAPIQVRPLLESAIQNQMKMLALGLRRTRERLLSFEQCFNMASSDFERRFSQRELSESLDFIEWFGEIKTSRLLEDQHRALQGLCIH